MKRRPIVAALALALVLVPAVPRVFALEEADRLFLVGERALADRYFAVARRTLERFVSRYPSDARRSRALLMLGQAQLRLSDPEAALESLGRAQPGLTSDAEVREAKFWQAEAQFRLKRFAEARVSYDEILRSDAAGSMAPDALYGLGSCELELKRPEPAITAFHDFLTTWPEHTLAPAATLQLARALMDGQRISEALPLLTGFKGKYPDSGSKLAGDAQYLLGYAKYTNGDRQGGLADIAAFVAANPTHPEAPAARRLLAAGLGKHGNRTQRVDAYKTLMKQDPATAQGYYDAATIAGELGLRAEQDAAWKKLRAEFPQDPLTRKLAGDLAAVAFKQKSWKDAVALGTIAAQSDEAAVKAEAWLTVGEAELKQRRFAQAAKAFEAVRAVNDVEVGTRFRALAGLGLAREELKEWKPALEAYESVAKHSPDATLRAWAQERVAAVKTQVPKDGNGSAPKQPAKPADKPASKKS